MRGTFLGDSLFADDNSFPRVLDRLGHITANVEALGGIKMVDYTLPQHLVNMDDWGAQFKPDFIAVWLGTNDALKGTEPELFKMACHDLFKFLRRTEIPTYTLELPEYPGRPQMDDYNVILTQAFEYEQLDPALHRLVHCHIDFSDGQMDDEFHPDDGQHIHLSRWFSDVAGLGL